MRLRTNRRGTRSLAAIGTAALLAAGATAAFGDNLEADLSVDGGGLQHVLALGIGDSHQVSYYVQPTGNGCDAADGSPATVHLTLPAGVTASVNDFSLTDCGKESGRIVEFTLDAASAYGEEITATVTDARGTYNEEPAKVKLKAPGDAGDGGAVPAANTPPSVEITGDEAADEGSTGGYSALASDDGGTAALTYEWSLAAGNGEAELLDEGEQASTTVGFIDGLNPASKVALTVTVMDAGGLIGTATKDITVNNLAPVLSALQVTGGTGTACIGGNTVGITYSLTDAGVNDQPAPSVNWGDGTTDALSSHTYGPGSFGITVDATDKDGAAADQLSSGAGAVSHFYAMSGILQPVNADGSSVFTRKKGSTIPVKVRITDCNGDAVPGLYVPIRVNPAAGTSWTETPSVTEPVSTSAADTTGRLRFSPGATSKDGQYIYNLNTLDIATGGNTVEVRQAQSSPSSQQAAFKLK